MAKRPRTDWTPQMIADFKLFYEERHGKKELSHDVKGMVRADMKPLDIGV